MRFLPLLLCCALASAGEFDFVSWPMDAAELKVVLAELDQVLPAGRPVAKATFAKLETALHTATPLLPLLDHDVVTVAMPDGSKLDVYLALPEGYAGGKKTPLVLAFGGGPIPKGPRGDRMAQQQATMMRSVWRAAANRAGWIVAAVDDNVSRADPGVRYEVVRPYHLDAVLRALRGKLNIDEDHTIMTGISLGSNYALACGAAQPHLFAGAVPVATEGEARAPLLRNLRSYPLYALVGARDRNIRGISGPRTLDATLRALGYDHVYEEFAARGHEGFSERYGKVLAWFADRPRRFWAREVVRVPHPGILAPSRTFRWITCDTRQGAVRARITKNTIDIDAASLTSLDLLLSDRLVDLDQPVVVRVNGQVLHKNNIARDLRLAVRHAATTRDRSQVPAARLTITVPRALATGKKARAFATAMRQDIGGGANVPLAHWETYALRHLRATRKRLGLKGELVDGGAAPGLRITTVAPDSPAAAAGVEPGDVVTAFDGNGFFAGDDPQALMDLWCLREEFAGKDVSLTIRKGAKTTQVAIVLRASSKPYR